MDDYEARVGIDNQTMNSLFLANGGGIIALLAFLQNVIGDPTKDALSVSILIGLVVLCFGVFATIKCNHSRRECSLEYKKNSITAPASKSCVAEKIWRCYAFSTLPTAGVIVLIGGIIFMCCRRCC